MQAFLFAGFVTLAAAGLPDKVALKSVFIDGSGPRAPNFLTQAQIDSIDRELVIEYDHPALTIGSAMPHPFNDTCGQGTITCPAHKFSVTPGMDVSTMGTRGYAMTSASDYMTTVAPTITFNMSTGKKYTFMMVDGYSAAAHWSTILPSYMEQGMHYYVSNMTTSSGLSAALKTSYVSPKNPVIATPSIYAFMVWEHTQTATHPGEMGYMNSEFTVQKWIAAAGIANASLVAMNYFKGYGNVYSRAALKSRGLSAFAPNCTAGGYSSADKMCMPLSSTPTGGTTTTTTITTVNSAQAACAVPSNATNPTMIATYIECLDSQCEDAATTWLDELSAHRRLAAGDAVLEVTCTNILAATQNNCSMKVASALGLLLTNNNKLLDSDVAQAVESFTVNSMCSNTCGNKCNDGASNPAGTTDGSALVNAAPITSIFVPFVMLAPTALLLSMCL